MQIDDNLEQLYKNVTGEVICRFETKLSPKLRVDSSEIILSTEMDQQALQLLIGNLLAQKIAEQSLSRLHFEFLIGGELLRGKIKSHLVRYTIFSENVIDIEYFLAVGTPQETHQTPEQDWVSCLSVVPGIEERSYMVGLFNGSVSLYTDHVLQVREAVSVDPIKALRCLPSPVENQHYMLSGGYSESIQISTVSTGETSNSITLVGECIGSDACVQSIDISPLLDGLFCSTSGNTLSIWRLPQNIGSQRPAAKKKKKKVHLNTASVHAEASEQIHELDILSSMWSSSNQIICGSMDHSISLTDVEKLQKRMVFRTADSVPTSVDARHGNILSAHEDGYVRMWDERIGSNCTKKFKSHTKYTSCVKFSSSANVFCSASYDHTVKLWDTRSIFPLQTITTHHDKVFTLMWKRNLLDKTEKKQIISGGSDSIVAVHSIESPHL